MLVSSPQVCGILYFDPLETNGEIHRISAAPVAFYIRGRELKTTLNPTLRFGSLDW